MRALQQPFEPGLTPACAGLPVWVLDVVVTARIDPRMRGAAHRRHNRLAALPD